MEQTIPRHATAFDLQQWLARALRGLGTIDLRALALFRVVVSFAVVLNVITYLPDATAFFTDAGIAPRNIAVHANSGHRWSLLMMGGDQAWVFGFFLLNLLAGLALMLGWNTRLATVVCWLCAVSLRHRAGMFNSLADTQLTILLFWAIFLPLGARFSIDAGLRRGTDESNVQANAYLSIASIAVLLNVMYLYFVGALEKTGEYWVQDFTAAYYAVHAAELTTPLSSLLAGKPELMRGLTQFTYWVELSSPLLLFSPIFTQPLRMLGVPLLMSLHLGFVLLLGIGIFPWVSLSGLCLFLPSLFWNRLERLRRSVGRSQGIIMWFDRDCGFCEKTCRIFRALGLPADTRIEPAQDTPEIAAVLERENSWVVRTHDGRQLLRWSAVSYVWRRVPLLAPLGWLFLLPGSARLGDRIYRGIGDARPLLSRWSSRLLPWTQRPLYYPSGLVTLLLLPLLPASLWLCLQQARPHLIAPMPDWVRAPVQTIGLSQRWNMFAPNSTPNSRWVVAEGELATGGKIDAIRQRAGAPDQARPINGWELYSSFRWRKYFSRVKWRRDGKRLARYHCEKWNAWNLQNPIVNVTYFVYRQRTALPGEVQVDPKLLGRHTYACAIPEGTEIVIDPLEQL